MIGRMGRALIAVGVALVLAIGGLGLAVYLARDEDNIHVDLLLSEDLTRAISLAHERDGRVVVPRYAGFDWDSVLIIARGTPAAAISDRLGREWTGITGFEGTELLVFVRDGEPVRFADYRGDARFEGFEQPIAELPRERAILTVRDGVVRPAG
jgi:hypothetical protein